MGALMHGTTRTSLPLSLHKHSPAKQCEHVKATAQDKNNNKKPRNSSLTPKNTELSSFQMTSVRQVICCVVDWKRVMGNAHVKNKEKHCAAAAANVSRATTKWTALFAVTYFVFS